MLYCIKLSIRGTDRFRRPAALPHPEWSMSRYRSQKNILFLTLTAFILGFLIMLTARTNYAGEVEEAQDTQELVAYIESMEAQTLAEEERIQVLREQIDAIQSEQAEGETLLTTMNDSLARLTQYAGMTALVGEGLILELNDNTVGAELAQKSNPATYRAENYIIHDTDLLYLVRAMSAYTEALSINNIRIIDTTSIRCVGTVILVNATRLAPPYEIRVIGDPAALTRSLQASSRYISLTERSMPLKLTTSQQVEVPAYSGVYSPTYSSLLPSK